MPVLWFHRQSQKLHPFSFPSSCCYNSNNNHNSNGIKKEKEEERKLMIFCQILWHLAKKTSIWMGKLGQRVISIFFFFFLLFFLPFSLILPTKVELHTTFFFVALCFILSEEKKRLKYQNHIIHSLIYVCTGIVYITAVALLLPSHFRRRNSFLCISYIFQKKVSHTVQLCVSVYFYCCITFLAQTTFLCFVALS